MIYMRIWEGLGNQMFQYAYIRALQLRNGVDVRLCVLPANSDGYTPRQYGLDNLRIRLKRDPHFEKIARVIEKNKILQEILQYSAEKRKGLVCVSERNVQYKEDYKYLKGNYYISGWFQHENYFKDYEEVIRKELKPKYKIHISHDLADILSKKNTVSVHIRRSDFKRYNNLMPMEYYEKAMKLINSKIGDVFYIIFSDEPSWVECNMEFGENAYFMKNEKNLQDYEELFVMSKCKHNIIANSTFSWWGAWLNDNNDKLVIGPQRWFANNRLNIMPDEWIKL